MYIHEYGCIYILTNTVLAVSLHDCIVSNGRAKILLKENPKVVVNDAISSKVSTLHPKPNTLLDIYRENLFPQQPSTSTRKNFFLFVCFILYKHYLVSLPVPIWEGIWKKVPSFSVSCLLASSVRLQALPIAGGWCPTTLVSKVVKTQ